MEYTVELITGDVYNNIVEFISYDEKLYGFYWEDGECVYVNKSLIQSIKGEKF